MRSGSVSSEKSMAQRISLAQRAVAWTSMRCSSEFGLGGGRSSSVRRRLADWVLGWETALALCGRVYDGMLVGIYWSAWRFEISWNDKKVQYKRSEELLC